MVCVCFYFLCNKKFPWRAWTIRARLNLLWNYLFFLIKDIFIFVCVKLLRSHIIVYDRLFMFTFTMVENSTWYQYILMFIDSCCSPNAERRGKNRNFPISKFRSAARFLCQFFTPLGGIRGENHLCKWGFRERVWTIDVYF